MGWFRTPVPFYFKIFRASPFLRNISHLRRSTALRVLSDTAASTRLGSLGLSILDLAQRVLGRYPRTANLRIERFDQWEDWADETWERARDSYALIGDRSKAALRSLYPPENERLIKLRITSRNSQALIGWAVLTHAKMKNHKFFGNMALAALVDMLAVPEHAFSVVSGALAAARRAQADLLVVNHSDERWHRAFKLAGMLPWKSNYYLSISPQLKERFDAVETDSGRFYFTRGDGHGPTRLWLSDDNFNEAELEFSGNNNDGFLGDGKQLIKKVDLLSTGEKRYLLEELNATQMDYPRQASLHHLFEVQAERTPEEVAVVFEDEQITYRELNRRANQLAHHLGSLGVNPDTLVGICLERSADMVVGLLGILKAGGAYVPLDPGYPRERLAFMLSDSRAAVLVTERRLAEALPEHGARTVYLDADWETISQLSEQNPTVPVQPSDRAYVIYTSGSTGTPKGVQIPHGAAVNFLKSMEQRPGLTSDDVLLAVTTLSFDIHVLEIFLPLVVGARVIIVGRGAAADGRQLIENLDASGATIMQATPVTWRLLLGAGWQGNKRLKVLCGGEALPRELANQLLEKCASLWNMYGPTETTVWSAVHRVAPGEGNVPIGRPIANTQVYVLDEALQLQPIGVPGELYIGGDGLALGYLNRPDLTAERFIAHPFSREGKARLYKTGDLARYLPGGELECLGRLDHQVKIRGFRIELGEVESVLSAHPDLRQVAVIAREDVPGDKRLVAYLVANGHREPSIGEVRSFLKDRLPDYMIPAVFVFLDSLPLTPNLKVDRKSLPAPEWLPSVKRSDYVEPRNDLERFLVETWCSVLQTDKVGIHDNFFELGGDSLRGAIFINKVQQKLDAYIYVVALFDSPTVAEFVAYLQNRYPEAVARAFGDILAVDEEDTAERAQSVDEGMVRQIRTLIPSGVPRPEKDGANKDKNPPAIFILSTPRSGTTLVRVMLAGNPHLFAPPELELLGFNTLKERKSALDGGYSLWSEGTIRAIMEIKSCDAGQAKKIMADYENRNLTTMEFYRVLQEWIGERRLVDKSTTYALDLETLQRAEDYFYQPRYIYLSRHPYGMIESFQKVSLDQVFFRYEHPFSPSQLAELIWIICHQNIQEFLMTVPQTRQCRLRYEDLVKQPVEISQELCRFLDIPFHPDMARPYKNKDRKMTDGIHAVSTMLGDMKFHQHSGIDPTLAERWKESLKEDFLSDIAWEIAERLGYSRLNVRSIAEPRRKLEGTT
jgi:amino acid adenylation domain-containing protein